MSKAPRAGQIVEFNNRICRIVKVHCFGTIDIVEVDGNGAWRVTGLAF